VHGSLKRCRVKPRSVKLFVGAIISVGSEPIPNPITIGSRLARYTAIIAFVPAEGVHHVFAILEQPEIEWLSERVGWEC